MALTTIAFAVLAIVAKANAAEQFSLFARLNVSFNDISEKILTVPEIIEKYGYYHETHNVTTEDGYILTLFRLCKKTCANKKPIYVQHGFANAAAEYVFLGPNRSFGFILADQDFDVWLGNARGTENSRGHTKLNADLDASFWKFSLTELGVYDIPANIDHILNQTNQKQLYYIGHSQGTTTLFLGLSKRPEYNAKIKAYFALSPVAYIHYVSSIVFQTLSKFLWLFYALENVLNDFSWFYDITLNHNFLYQIGKVLCSDGKPTQGLCKTLLVQFLGFSNLELNATMIPHMMQYTPAAFSCRQLVHYLQLIDSGYFRDYDFGQQENIKHYNAQNPPNFSLGKVVAPGYLFYSSSDFLNDILEIETKTSRELGNVKEKHLISEYTFNHNDHVYGSNAKKFVYDPVINIIKRLEQTNTITNTSTRKNSFNQSVYH